MIHVYMFFYLLLNIIILFNDNFIVESDVLSSVYE